MKSVDQNTTKLYLCNISNFLLKELDSAWIFCFPVATHAQFSMPILRGKKI